MAENQASASFTDVLKDGTKYFFDNYLLLACFYLLPVIAVGVFFFTNAVANPIGLFTPSGLTALAAVAVFFTLLYPYAVAYFTLRVASRDPEFGPVGGNIAMLALKRLPGVIVFEVMISGFIMLCAVFLFFPALIAMYITALAMYVYILHGGMAMSIQESRELMRGNFGNIILLIAMMIAVYIAQSVANAILGIFFKGLSGVIPAFFTNIFNAIFSFWLFALYKRTMTTRGFTHSPDRKAAKTRYKVLAAVSLIFALGFGCVLPAAIWAVIESQKTSMGGFRVAHAGKSSTLYAGANPVMTTEEKGFATTQVTIYGKDGVKKTEYYYEMLKSKGETREYLPDGKQKSVTTIEEGKAPQIQTHYENGGKTKGKYE